VIVADIVIHAKHTEIGFAPERGSGPSSGVTRRFIVREESAEDQGPRLPVRRKP